MPKTQKLLPEEKVQKQIKEKLKRKWVKIKGSGDKVFRDYALIDEIDYFEDIAFIDPELEQDRKLCISIYYTSVKKITEISPKLHVPDQYVIYTDDDDYGYVMDCEFPEMRATAIEYQAFILRMIESGEIFNHEVKRGEQWHIKLLTKAELKTLKKQINRACEKIEAQLIKLRSDKASLASVLQYIEA